METPDETFEAVAEFAIAWQAGDERPIVRDFAEAAEEAIRICATPDTAISADP
jgi:hypothetical protein